MWRIVSNKYRYIGMRLRYCGGPVVAALVRLSWPLRGKDFSGGVAKLRGAIEHLASPKPATAIASFWGSEWRGGSQAHVPSIQVFHTRVKSDCIGYDMSDCVARHRCRVISSSSPRKPKRSVGLDGLITWRQQAKVSCRVGDSVLVCHRGRGQRPGAGGRGAYSVVHWTILL